MEAATALKDAETMGLVAYLQRLKRTREEKEDSEVDYAALVETMTKTCNAEMMRRHN
jgi:hypothetical protein